MLLCGLHFPNGVQLLNPHANNSPLLLAESARFRILKVNVQAPRLRDQQGLDPLLSSCREEGAMASHLKATTKKSRNQYVSTWLDGAPGFIDNIRPDSKRVQRWDGRMHLGEGRVRFLVGLGTKSSQPFSLLWLAYQLQVCERFFVSSDCG